VKWKRKPGAFTFRHPARDFDAIQDPAAPNIPDSKSQEFPAPKTRLKPKNKKGAVTQSVSAFKTIHDPEDLVVTKWPAPAHQCASLPTGS
jgi:hypothetical protein